MAFRRSIFARDSIFLPSKRILQCPTCPCRHDVVDVLRRIQPSATQAQYATKRSLPRHPGLRTGFRRFDQSRPIKQEEYISAVKRVIQHASRVRNLEHRVALNAIKFEDFMASWLTTCLENPSRHPGGSVPPAAWKAFVAKSVVQPWEYYTMYACRILGSSTDWPAKELGRRLLTSMSHAGSETATVRVMSAGLRAVEEKGRGFALPPFAREVEARFAQIVSKGDNMQALVLAGKIAQFQGKTETTLRLWWKALDQLAKNQSTGKPLKQSEQQSLYRELYNIDHLQAPWNDLTTIHGERAAAAARDGKTKIADFELSAARKANDVGCSVDDPNSHFIAAEYAHSDWDWRNDVANTYNAKYFYHMSKAASGGHAKAAYRMAQYYCQAAWPYFEDPPDAIKPTAFDRTPGNPTVKRAPTEVESAYFHAQFPSSVEHRLQMAIHWADQACGFYYAPSFILLAELYLAREMQQALVAPEQALSMSPSRYEINSTMDYERQVPVSHRDAARAKWLITEAVQATMSVRYYLRLTGQRVAPPRPRGSQAMDESEMTQEQVKWETLHGPQGRVSQKIDYHRQDFDDAAELETVNWFLYPDVRASWVEEWTRLEHDIAYICAREGWDTLYDHESKLIFENGQVVARDAYFGSAPRTGTG